MKPARKKRVKLEPKNRFESRASVKSFLFAKKLSSKYDYFNQLNTSSLNISEIHGQNSDNPKMLIQSFNNL